MGFTGHPEEDQDHYDGETTDTGSDYDDDKDEDWTERPARAAAHAKQTARSVSTETQALALQVASRPGALPFFSSPSALLRRLSPLDRKHTVNAVTLSSLRRRLRAVLQGSGAGDGPAASVVPTMPSAGAAPTAAGVEGPSESRARGRDASGERFDHRALDPTRVSSPLDSPEYSETSKAAAASSTLRSGSPSPKVESAASPGLAPTAAEQDEHDASNDSFGDPALGYPVGDVKDEPLDVPVEDRMD